MANRKRLQILKFEVLEFNKWRKENPTTPLDLGNSNLEEAMLILAVLILIIQT